MFQKLKRWWFIYKVRNRAHDFLTTLNEARSRAKQEHRKFDMSVFGPETLYESEVPLGSSIGVRIFLKPFYLDTGFFTDPYSILLLREPPSKPRGFLASEKLLNPDSFKAEGLEFDYSSPEHLYKALDLKLDEWSSLLEKEVVKSVRARQRYLEGVMSEFPTVNSLIAPKVTAPCETCGFDLEFHHADLELTTCRNCSTEHVLVSREKESVLIKISEGRVLVPRRLTSLENVNEF